MAAGDLITTDYQYEYNDLLLGVDTAYDVSELAGFLGFPSLRTSTVDAFGQHGGTRGRHYAPLRNFSITFNIQGDPNSGLNYYQQRSAVSAAFAPREQPTDELPFVYQHEGAPKRFILCRPIDLDWGLNRQYGIRYPQLSVRFEASDPRHYSLETKTEIAPLPTTGDGLEFPLTFPLDFGAGQSSSVNLVNEGDAPAHWTASIIGPVTNPRIEVTSVQHGFARHMEFQGLTLLTGEVLELDSRARTILLAGQSRRTFLTASSRWFAIPPLPDMLVLHYTSGDTSFTPSTCTIEWSDATWGN